jgi:glucokinase
LTDGGDKAIETCAIGLDIGGTKISAGMVSFPSGKVLNSVIVPTYSERGGEAVLENAVGLVENLSGTNGNLPVCGIGIGIAELVDLSGNITSGHTINWQGLNIRDAFTTDLPLIIESDVRAGALAEARLGAGRGHRILIYVTVGTGISSCLVVDGVPFTGANGNALILASTPWTNTCAHCGQVTQPVLEDISSGPALVGRYNAISDTKLAGGEEVLAAAKSGDDKAIHVVATAGELLGVSVGFLVNVMDPEAVVVGGGLGLTDGLYWSRFLESARGHIWAEQCRSIPVKHARLGADAGLVGAAAKAYLAFCRSARL